MYGRNISQGLWDYETYIYTYIYNHIMNGNGIVNNLWDDDR